MKITRIPFGAPMMRAQLEGRKTQTRRIVKQCKDPDFGCWLAPCEIAADENMQRMCPYGRPGDLLIPVEAWRVGRCYDHLCGSKIKTARIHYECDGQAPLWAGRYRHARFMPRWASRLTLRITDVRVQRLQDISNSDCAAEGISYSPDVNLAHEYQELWESINPPGSWNANPYVWALTFDVIKANVDEVLKQMEAA